MRLPEAHNAGAELLAGEDGDGDADLLERCAAQDLMAKRGQRVAAPVAFTGGSDQIGEVRADRALRGVAEDPLGGRAPFDDPPGDVGPDHAIERRRHQPLREWRIRYATVMCRVTQDR